MSKNSEFTVDDPADKAAPTVARNARGSRVPTVNEQTAAMPRDPKSVEPVAEPAAEPEAPAVVRRRQPLNGRSLKLQVYGEVPGYHLHVAKDEGARISLMQEAGYDFVMASEIQGVGNNVASHNTDPGGKVRFVIGSNGAEPQYGYLMKIPDAFFKEDQAALEATNMAIDEQIRGGKVRMTQDEQRYQPKGVVQYQPQTPTIFTKSKP